MVIAMGQTDVKETVQNNVADSSTAKVQNTGTDQADSSAGDVKTESDKTPEHVPYSRFKEVNDQLKTLKDKEEAYGYYEQFDKLLETNPELNDIVTKTVTDYRDGKISKKEAESKIESATENTSGNSSIESVTFHLYNQEFMSLAKNDKYESDEDIQALGAATTTILKQMNPKAFNVFTPNIVKKAYGEAKKIFEGFASRRTQNYIKDKVDENNPPVTTGHPATTETKIMSREDAVKHMANGLKQMNK